MLIEFVESKQVGASADLYEKRVDHLDQQVSKAVLGQTATTDAIAGGHAVGQEHRQVQEDIERADAGALAAILNRDLIRPWMLLEFGELGQESAAEDRPRRRDRRQADRRVRRAPGAVRAGCGQKPDARPDRARQTGRRRFFFGPAGRHGPWGSGDKGHSPAERRAAGKCPDRKALHGQLAATLTPEDVIAGAAKQLAAPAADSMLDTIRELVDRAGSLAELKAMLEADTPNRDAADLALAMRQALVVAELAGRAEILAPDPADG
jgi:phage gp29-like protein